MTLVARVRRRAALMTRRVVRVAALPAAEQRATLHALLALAVVEALIRWVRLPRLAGLLGIALQQRGTAAGVGAVEAPATTTAAVRATQRVLRRWPFGRGPCLRESLVLGHLLRRHEPVLRIGVAGSGADLRAHAWLEVGGHVLGSSRGYATFLLPPAAA